MSTFANCPKEDLIKWLNQEASVRAERLKIKRGGLIVCLRPVTEQARKWTGTTVCHPCLITAFEFNQDTKSKRKASEKTQNNIIFMIPDYSLDEMATDAIERSSTILYDEDRLKCYDYGTSYCYPIHDSSNDIISMYIVVVASGRTSTEERDICLSLHNSINAWCKENDKWIPRPNPRSIASA